MARSVSTSLENAFTRGLITEVTGVNSPENSVTETTNVIYDRKGRALTRKGFEYEDGAVQNAIGQTGVRNEFVWETVSDNNTKDFVVIQLGTTIRFFEITGQTPLSSELKSFSVNLLTYKIGVFTDAQVRETLCSFTVGKGYLFVAHPNCQTLYVAYDDLTDTISVNTIAIKIRDFEGVDDGLEIDVRPTVETALHKYNLFNQGWYTEAQAADTTNVSIVPVYNYWQARGDYPSNADVWWYYTTIQPGGDTVGIEAMNIPSTYARVGLFGNTPAAKGHYIVDALETNRSSQSGIVGIPETSSGGLRPSVIAFFTGRAFYGGIGKSGFSSTIYFSQIIEEDEQLGRCYQSNDPTSKESFDLLASDGGTIKIQDINTILDMRVIGQAIYVFASNGVWAITGTENGPFKATDYTVSKVSSFPAISKTSIVDVGGFPLWWNYEGIFSLQKTELGLTSDVTNLTQTTIQAFYDAIPQSSKVSAKGSFNDQSGLVYWIYNVLPDEGLFKYTNILVFDVVSTAFYPLSIPDTSKEISGILAVRSVGSNFINDPVVTSLGDPVVTSLGDPVFVVVQDGFAAQPKAFKFLTVDGLNVSFSEIKDDTYLDWGTEAYDHYFVTGYRIRGDLLKEFQTNYLTVITQEIANGSCYVQGVWDYAYDPDSGRYSNPQQVYRQRTFRNYQRSKLKVRGNGYSLQFKFFGEDGKPFILTGWAGFETGNTIP